jgi:hypothetical protein
VKTVMYLLDYIHDPSGHFDSKMCYASRGTGLCHSLGHMCEHLNCIFLPCISESLLATELSVDNPLLTPCPLLKELLVTALCSESDLRAIEICCMPCSLPLSDRQRLVILDVVNTESGARGGKKCEQIKGI